MTTKKIPFNYDINRMLAVDLIAIIHIDDYDTRFLELTMFDDGTPFSVDGCIVTSRFVTISGSYLLSDNVPCEATGNTITIPIDAAAVQMMACDIKIEVNIVDGEKILTLPFPLWVRVRGSILEAAHVTPESQGTIPELLEAAQEALDAAAAALEDAGDYSKLDNKPQINGHTLSDNKTSSELGLQDKLTAGENVTIDENGVISAEGGTDDYNDLNNKPQISGVTLSGNQTPAELGLQKALTAGDNVNIDANGNITITGIVKYADGADGQAGTNGELAALDGNGALKRSGVTVAQSVGEGSADKVPTTEAVKTALDGKADKATTLAGYGITDAYTKTQTDTLLNAKESTANKVTAVNSSASDTQYPSAKAVFDFGADILKDVNEEISDTNADIADLKAYIGYTDGDILGLHADFENKVFTRLGAAVGLTAGQDFNAFTMYGGRRRCCVSNDGTINAYYGEQDYVEDGSNGQVMVYQPKFYYCMVPLKLEKQASGLGYHIRKANYYVTANPHPGFKLHPLFYDANGNEVDYVLLSAYEGSMYDVSESAYVNDGVDSISYASGDLLCSVSGKKPISGKLTSIGTRKNFEDMAQNRGTNWHLDTIQSVSANQLLMMIELGTLNVQSAVGLGVVTASDNGNYNCASLTGATASLGNATGMASTTIGESAGTETTETTNGKLSVSYRGVENPWGNIWKYINGINLWGNGSMNGGQAYICSDFTFSDSDRTQHYQPSGFTVSNSNGYASAFGYRDEAYDWLMIPSECTGSSIEPVGDQSYFKPDLNEFNIVRLGGSWNSNTNGGAYCWGFVYTPGFRYYFLGGRLLYVPTATGFGPQGPAGQNYVLTAQDKADIANIVLQELPTTQGVLYGNTSN